MNQPTADLGTQFMSSEPRKNGIMLLVVKGQNTGSVRFVLEEKAIS